MRNYACSLFALLLAGCCEAADFRSFARGWFGRDASRSAQVGNAVFPDNLIEQFRVDREAREALTVCGWARFDGVWTNTLEFADRQGLDRVATQLFFTPYAIRRDYPDMLGGVGGFPSGSPVPLPLTVALKPCVYDDPQMSNSFPHGVYVCVNAGDTDLTFSLGGETFTVKAGERRNCQPKTKAETVTVSGADVGRFAVAQTGGGQLFGADVAAQNAMQDGGQLSLREQATIGRDWAFWAFRLYTSGRCVYSNVETGVVWSAEMTVPFPRPVQAFSPQGYYSVFFYSMTGLQTKPRQLFDVRVFHTPIDDKNLLQIAANGRHELTRRGY